MFGKNKGLMQGLMLRKWICKLLSHKLNQSKAQYTEWKKIKLSNGEIYCTPSSLWCERCKEFIEKDS